MKSIFNKFVLFILFLLICRCNSSTNTNVSYVNTSDDGETKFDLTEALESKSVLYLDDLIDSIQIIPLETISQSLLSVPIWSIHVSSDNIFVQDPSNIIIFNHTGQFIKTLEKGSGPNEIGYPRVMFYNEKNNYLYVYDAVGEKIMKYSSNGVFLSYNSIDQHIAIRDFAVADSRMLLAQHEFSNNFALSIGDTLGTIDNLYVFGVDIYPFLFRKYIMPYEGGFNIKKLLDNKIYYCKDSIPYVKYILKYPMVDIDYSLYSKMSEMEDALPDGKYIFTGDYLETHDYLFTIFRSGGIYIKTLFTNKTSGNSVCFEGKPHSVINFVSIESTLTNGNNWFVGVIYPEHFASKDISEKYRWDGSNPNYLISDKDMEKLRAIDPDDNPIIVLFKLKDNI